MAMTLTHLRKNIFSIFDEILRTGKGVQVVRNGRKLYIRPETTRSKLAKITRPAKKAYIGDSDEIPGMNWEKEWNARHT